MTPKDPGHENSSDNLTESQQAELMSLVELQDFLQAELSETNLGYKRAFTPLTHGLGLESPVKTKPLPNLEPKGMSSKSQPEVQSTSRREMVTHKVTQSLVEQFEEEGREVPLPTRAPRTHARSEQSLASVIEAPVVPAEPLKAIKNRVNDEVEGPTTTPPPLPRPSFFRRLLAATIDQVFVLMLWCVGLVITSNLIEGGSIGFSVRLLGEFSKPVFQRMAALEFAALWIVYLGISLLAFQRTFGMWVWGISVSYGEDKGEFQGMRRLMRVFWSFIFSAPIIPSVLLIIRKNGRNVLDVLSGTNVYDAS